MIDSEQMKKGAVQIANIHGILDGGVAKFIRGSVLNTGSNAAAGHPDREGVSVMVAPGAFGRFGSLEHWGAAEFACENDEGGVEQTASFEVEEEGGDGLVDLLAKLGEAAVHASVGVPIAVE